MRAILIILIAFTFSANAKEDPPKQIRGTDGELIEQEFENIVNNCFGKNVNYSTLFFPDLLRSDPYKTLLARPKEATRIIDGIQFGLLARTVFANNLDINSSKEDIGRSRLIELPLYETVPMNEANSLVFALTCTTALKLAMEQSFEFSTSVFSSKVSAGIKHALQLQSSKDKVSSLALMYGIFRSPLSFALESQNDVDKADASSNIWLYYFDAQANNQPTKEAKYLRSIKGWLISRLNTQDLASMVGASIEGKGSLFGFDANLGTSAKFVLNSNLKNANFKIILDDEINESRDLVPLPTPKELSANINRAALFFPSEIVPFKKGKPTLFNSKLRGVPPWLCNRRWSIKTNPVTEISEITATPTGNQCDINFKSIITTNLDKIDVTLQTEDFSIMTSESRPENIQLFHTYALNAQVESDPIPSAPPNVTYRPEQINPTFNVSIAFSLMPNDSAIEVITKSIPTIKCPEGIAHPNLYPATEISLIAKNQYASNMAITFNDRTFTSTSCDIKVPVSFRIKNIEVDKELPSTSVKFEKPSKQ